MLMVVQNSRLFLTHINQTAVIPNAGILCILVNTNHLGHTDMQKTTSQMNLYSNVLFKLLHI